MQNDPFGFDPPEENQPPPATRKPIEGFDDVRGEVTVREKWDHGADIEEEIEKIHERKVTVRNWGMIKLFRRELYRRKNREPCTTSGQRGIAKKAEVRLTVMVKAFIALLEAIKQNYDSLLEEFEDLENEEARQERVKEESSIDIESLRRVADSDE